MAWHCADQTSADLATRVWFSLAQNVKRPEITLLSYGAIQIKLIRFDLKYFIYIFNRMSWTTLHKCGTHTHHQATKKQERLA